MPGEIDGTLMTSLVDLSKNFHGGWAQIKGYLDTARKALFDELSKAYPNQGFWTLRPDWHGALPQVPWVAFGLTSKKKAFNYRNEEATDEIDSYYPKGLHPLPIGELSSSTCLYINYQISADRRRLFLVILPFTEAWAQSYGPNWTYYFNPVKREIRSELEYLKNEGFSLDDHAHLGAKVGTKGYNMNRGYVVYKCYSLDKMPSNVDFKKDLTTMVDAYINLVRDRYSDTEAKKLGK